MSNSQQTPQTQYGALALQLKHRALLLLILALCAIGVFASYPRQSLVDNIIDSGKLQVITRLSPTNYFLADGVPGGFEYELSKAFANYLGVKLNMVSASDLSQIYEALRLNNVHFAAAGLAITAQRNERYDFTQPYAKRAVQVVYLQRRGFKPAKALEEISEGIRVPANSSYAEILKRLDPDHQRWLSSEYEDELDLLESVHNNTLDYTLVDADTFNANRSFFPRLKVAFSLADKQPIAWMLKERRDDSLKQKLNEFLALENTQALIEELQQQYFSNNQSLNLVDNLTFRQHLEDRLPTYKALFQQAAEETGLDWQLLAAIGYQESHWNPKAVSPTGVRGIMMLTQQTAKEVGVTKRTDPAQSILGGARYFLQQLERTPERIEEPDRTWLALATYNVGRGHLEDARILTQRAGMNPDKWEDVAKHLPLLAQARWYKTVKHGYARGREPVIYVNNIRRYLEQLELETRLEAVQMAQDEQIMNELENPPEQSATEHLPETL